MIVSSLDALDDGMYNLTVGADDGNFPLFTNDTVNGTPLVGGSVTASLTGTITIT